MAAKVAAGSMPADAVVPEGLEDVSLEGDDPRHVQVKSRGDHLGPFPSSAATRHIVDAWARHVERGETDAELVIVLERGVSGEPPLSNWDVTLAESLPDTSDLHRSLRAESANRGIVASEVARLLSSTVLVVISWDEVVAETVSLLGGLVDIPPAGLLSVAQQLRVLVADAADSNAARGIEDGRRLSLTELVGTIERLAELIDSQWLNAAIKEGVCEVLDYRYLDATDDGDRFYEGEASQPHHVARGLVVPRPDVIDEISSGLQERSAVVITGPSGVGKSAVLWTLPRELPGVLWYRVRRLADEDVPLIVRLARANLALPFSRVGFLVDSAGTGDFSGWARLRAEAAAVPGMLLVATARVEDLMTLGDLAEFVVVEVQLDEHTAERIYEGLAHRGATGAAHWREAFGQSDGLTLEFTHLLTRGHRLRELIGDQVRRRIREGRDHELEVLALASVADRWSATISTADVAAMCGLTDLELREAMERLHNEHLLVLRESLIGGLHRLRSAAICEAVHELPPPTMSESIARVIPLVPTAELHRFVASMLSDNPDARNVVVETARGDVTNVGRVAAHMQGLRLADFRERASMWNEIAEQREIPIAVRPVLFMFAVGEIDPGNIFPDEVNNTWAAMVAVAGRNSRDDLIAALGQDELAIQLASTSDIGAATQLLAVLAGVGAEFAEAVNRALTEQSTLTSALREAPIEALEDCGAAAYDAHPRLAESLVESIGGEAAVIERIRDNDPWITGLEISEHDSETVGIARFLHVPSAHQANPDEHAHSLGRTLLRCLPRIDAVDVRACLPGDKEVAVGGDVRGISRIRRANDHARPGAAWAQARTRAAIALIAEPDTERLTAVLPLLDEAANLVRRIGALTVTGRLITPELDRRLRSLHGKGCNLRPPYGPAQLGDTAILEQKSPQLANHSFDLIVAITGNVIQRFRNRPDEYRGLAAYIAETVIGKHLNGIADEPWKLVGITGHPAGVDELRTALDDVRAVAGGLANGDCDPETITRRALDGSTSRALRRAADACRTATDRRQRARRDDIRDACQATELQAEIFDSTCRSHTMIEHRIGIRLDSLLDWFAAVDVLGTALRENQPTGEIYAFVPLRHDRPVPRLAVKLISNLWPEPNPEGLENLRDPHPSALADAFDDAIEALQGLSGICCLPNEQREADKVQHAAEALAAQAATACEKLRELPGDTLTEGLLTIIGDLAARVQAENSGTSTDPNLAAQTLLIHDDEITPDLQMITTARCLALEWDIDPQVANSLLHSSAREV